MKKLLFLKTKMLGTLVVFLMMMVSSTTLFAQIYYGTAYTGTQIATGSTGTLDLGSLPPGLALDGTGANLIGTPTVPGTYTFTLSGNTSTVISKTVLKAAQSVTIAAASGSSWTCGSVKVVLDVTLTATPASGLPLTLTSSDTAVATVAFNAVSAKWEVTKVKAGIFEILASIPGNANYAALAQAAGGGTEFTIAALSSFTTSEAPQAQSFSTFKTVADLAPVSTYHATSAPGGYITKWYDTAGVLVPSNTTLVNGKVYYATKTVYGCESVFSAPVTVSLGAVAAPTLTAEQQTQSFCSGTVANLQNPGAASTTYSWYTAATGGTALATTVKLVTGTYYISQTTGGFESQGRTAVSVTVTQLAKPTGAATQYFLCATFAPKMSDIVVSATNLRWFSDSGLTAAITTDQALTDNTVYYAVSRNGALLDCYSDALAVTVYLNTPTIVASTAAPAAQTFCTETAAKLSNIQLNLIAGATHKWYAAASGGTAITTDQALANATVYYAAQVLNGCESTGRFGVTVTISTPANDLSAGTNTFCGTGKTVADLSPKSTSAYTVKWYNIDGALLLSTAPLASTSSTNTYRFTKTLVAAGSCESAKVAATVTVNTQSAAPTVANLTQNFCTGGTVADLLPAPKDTFAKIFWYTKDNSGALVTAASTDALVSGKYYVTRQAVTADCESVPVEVTVVVAPSVAIAQAVQPLCGTTFKVSDLAASGSNLSWYATSTSTVPMASTDAIISGQRYYVTQTVDGCESAKTATSFTVSAISATPTKGTTTATVTTAEMSVITSWCGAKTLTDLVTATGTADASFKWYNAASGAGTSFTALATGTYYLSVTNTNECESARLAVDVVVTVTPKPTTPATQEKLGGSTIGNLSVTLAAGASGAKWYETDSSTAVLLTSQVLTDGATYWVSQVVNGCESLRASTTVSLVSVLDLDEFAVGAFKFGPNPVRDILRLSHTNSIKSVEVFNMLGQQVLKLAPNAKQVDVDVNRLSSAMYIVKVTDDEDKSKGFRINKQ
ncbi:MAG: T9SS type A sorting domain-containing protein [Flavobacteriaceae bacterium]|nr:T9SS type A sorting domain-containing protein [Flavobacteriaceae bacterium]